MVQSFNLLVALLFAISCFATDYLQADYFKPKRIVFAIYGNDCVNCYLGASKSYSQLKGKERVTFIIGNVPKRISASFFEQKIGEMDARDTIIASDSLFNQLSPGKTSMVFIIESNIVQLAMPFKSVQWNLLNDKIKGKKYTNDTLDITPYAGTIQTTINIVAADKVYITNDVSSKTYWYNPIKSKIERKYDFTFLTQINEFLIDSNINLSSTEKVSNKTRNDTIVSHVGTRTKIQGAPHFIDSFIYLPISFFAEKMMKFDNRKDSSLALMPTQSLVKLSQNKLDIKRYYSFAFQIEGTSNLYNDIKNGHFNNSQFSTTTSSLTHDSLIAVYNLNNFSQRPIAFYNIKYPDYFPLKNVTGMNLSYMGEYFKMQGKLYYRFNVDPVLYELGGEKIDLPGFSEKKFKEDLFPVSWIYLVQEDKGTLLVLNSEMGNRTYACRYDLENFQLLSKVLIADKELNIKGYINGKLYCYEQNDETAELHIMHIDL